jgi:tight adherence protein B
MSEVHLVFIGMVFVAVLLLSQGLVTPVFGENKRIRKRMNSRLKNIEEVNQGPTVSSILRKEYLVKLSPFGRWMESLPGMESLRLTIEQSGRTHKAHHVVLLCLILAVMGAIISWYFLTHQLLMVFSVALVCAYLPLLKIKSDRIKRLEKFEEQLPEALDVMVRALRAGHPFSHTMQMVADEMPDPVAKEFGLTFSDINYGNDVRSAMLGLLERVPSMNVMAFVTSIIVQKETGGNLTELLSKISAVIRGRFKLNRKVRTLSAEGRMSAWVLTLIPFILFIMIMVTTPDYLVILTDSPQGLKLITISSVGMIIGIYWLRRIIRIEV